MWFGVLPMYPYFWRMNHSAAKRAKSYGGAQRVPDGAIGFVVEETDVPHHRETASGRDLE